MLVVDNGGLWYWVRTLNSWSAAFSDGHWPRFVLSWRNQYMIILITMMVAVINEYHNDCDDSLYWWQWLDMGCNGQWRSNDQDGHESWYMTGIWMLMLMCWWRSPWQWECQWLREPPFLSRAVNDPSQSRMIIMIWIILHRAGSWSSWSSSVIWIWIRMRQPSLILWLT